MQQITSFSHLVTAEISDLGLRRARNEDAIIRLPEAGVFCVADGIGGADVGHEASSTTVLTLLDFFKRAHYHPKRTSFEFRRNLVREAMNNACQIIRQYCAEKGYRESGTTAVTMVFDMENRGQAAVLHAGDSRAYRFRNGHFERLTKDHTLAIETGWPDKNAWVFGMRTIITRAVGVRPFVELDETMVDVQPGDVFLLCSDGLTRMLHDDVISELINHHGVQDLDTVVRKLVNEANMAGGKDNITILLVRVDEVMQAMYGGKVHHALWNKFLSVLPGWLTRRSRKAACTAIR